MRKVISRLVRSIPITGIALAAVGCAPMNDGGFKTSSPREVLTASFKNLSSRYIEPVDLKAISIDGLQQLRDIDPSIDVVHGPNSISLTTQDGTAGRWSIPGRDDPTAWAELVANAMQAARIASPSVATQSETAISNSVFRGVMSSFDRYTRYAGPLAAQRQRASRDGFGGLGISIRYDDGRTLVQRVHPGTPASRAGVRADDWITHVDDKAIAGASRATVIELLRGSIGSTVSLGVVRKTKPEKSTIKIKRALIVSPTVTTRRKNNVLSIKVVGFNQGTAAAISDALSRAKRDLGRKFAGIVLDLRGNPGGLLDQAVAVADLFLVDGPVISTVGRHPKSFQEFDATWGELAPKVPVAVLINGKSASAAEIVAVALRDRRRAVVIGSASYGKGTVQTIIRLPNDGELTMTWARMMAPSGFAIQDHGIIPAICTSGRGVTKLLQAIRRRESARIALTDLQLRARMSRRRNPDLARAACPPRVEQPGSDLEIARFLLTDRKLYTHALVVERPPVAERERPNTAARP